jgi:hypothetical protein
MTASIQTPQEFWTYVVVPDYQEFMGKVDDLRLAFHCAISLFHMADWVYETYKPAIDSSFVFADRKSGVSTPVRQVSQFANAISDLHPDFELIRQIANTAKHLQLTSTSPHPNAPTNAANTAVQSTGFGQGGFGQGPFGGTPRVMLANHRGQPDIEFSVIATTVFNMWQSLSSQHGW